MSHNDNDKIRDSSTVSNPPLSNVLFEALGSRIIFDREKIVVGAFNIGCPLGPFPTEGFKDDLGFEFCAEFPAGGFHDDCWFCCLFPI